MLAVTHDGVFHADDVLGAAILRKAHKDIEIVRTRDPKIMEEADILFDVGNTYDPATGKFDHHQANPPRRKNGIPNSASSLLWSHYRKDAIYNTLIDLGYGNSEFFHDHFENIWRYIGGHIDYTLFVPTDVIDNGAGKYVLMDKNLPSPYKATKARGHERGNPHIEEQYIHPDCQAYSVSAYLKTFNVAWWEDETEEEKQAGRFEEAVDIGEKMLTKLIEDAFHFQMGRRTIIDKALETSNSDNPHVLVLDRYIPFKSHLWADDLRRVDIQFVLYPKRSDSREEWMVAGVSPAKNAYNAVKTPFPNTWGGLNGEDLQLESGYDDAIFCHRNLGLAAFGSKESAVKAATRLASNERVSERPRVPSKDLIT